MSDIQYRPGACLMYPCIVCGQMNAEPAWFVYLRGEGRDFYGNSIPILEPNTIHDACITTVFESWFKTKTFTPLAKKVLNMWLLEMSNAAR